MALSGCVNGSGFSDLNHAATPDDRWPSVLPDHSTGSLDVTSSRLVGEFESSQLFLARSIEAQGGVCLLIFADASDWTVGCGTSGMSVEGTGSRTFTVRGDGALDDGLDAVSENVFVIAE